MSVPKWIENPSLREVKYFTTPAAVYRLWDADGNLLYIGSAYEPDHRCKDHRKKPWWPEVARRTEEWCPSRGRAYKVELEAIAVENAKYNRMGTPEYVCPDTPGTRSRRELAPLRQKYVEEASSIETQVSREQCEAGATDAEARRAGKLAAIEFLESTGIMDGAVKWRRSQMAYDDARATEEGG